VGVLPAFAILINCKGTKSWSLSTLISGLALVALATAMLVLMENYSVLYKLLLEKGKISPDVAETSKNNIKLWSIMFPAIIGAIGANLITSWVQSEKPSDT